MHLFRKVFTEYFVLQSLHKALPRTTLNYKACTEYTPVVLCTTRLEENTWRTRATPFCKQPLQFRGTKTNYNKICMTTAPPVRMTTNTLTNSLFAVSSSIASKKVLYLQNRISIQQKLRLQTRIPAPNRRINDFEAHFKRNSQRMARERRGAGSSLVSMETPYYKTLY